MKKDDFAYVDLGLDSGTLWSNQVEIDDKGYEIKYNYTEAQELCLPTQEQYEEMFSHCQQWNYSDLIHFSAPNGQEIRLLTYLHKILWVKSDIVDGCALAYIIRHGQHPELQRIPAEEENHVLMVKHRG